jgi:hypothetical protein
MWYYRSTAYRNQNLLSFNRKLHTPQWDNITIPSHILNNILRTTFYPMSSIVKSDGFIYNKLWCSMDVSMDTFVPDEILVEYCKVLAIVFDDIFMVNRGSAFITPNGVPSIQPTKIGLVVRTTKKIHDLRPLCYAGVNHHFTVPFSLQPIIFSDEHCAKIVYKVHDKSTNELLNSLPVVDKFKPEQPMLLNFHPNILCTYKDISKYPQTFSQACELAFKPKLVPVYNTDLPSWDI